MDGWTDRQNFSPFYRTLSPFGAAAQKVKNKNERERYIENQTDNCTYHQTGWIGTVEVNWDPRLKPGETFCLSVSPGLSPVL